MQFPRPGRLLLWAALFVFLAPIMVGIPASLWLSWRLDPVQSFYLGPYLVSALYRSFLRGFLLSTPMVGLSLMSWLCAGVLLMTTNSARKVRMAFGTISGEGMSVSLAFGFAMMAAALPTAAAIISARVTHEALVAPSALLILSAVLYVFRLNSVKDGSPI